MDALKILTIDAWREVLDRVKNPEDHRSCSESCLLFQALLWKKKNAFLFELILPKIIEHLPEMIQVPREAMEPEEEVSWKPVYDCRAICKDWCKSIDRFAETTVYGHLFQYWFDSGDTTQRFLNTFSTHTGNPFVGRRVTIEHRSTLLMAPPQGDDQNEFVDQTEIFHITKIRQLLSRFGKEIWVLELFESNENQHLALCKNVQTILGQLPNLREFRVNKSIFTVEQGNMDELPAYIAANPLPRLPHLERVYVTDLNPIMVRAILEKYSPQLKSLSTWWDSTRFPEELSRFNCIKQLNLHGLDASVSLQCFRQLHSPLEELYLNLAWNREERILWPIDELFRSIQHLPVRKLSLIMRNFRVFLGESAPELRIRHESIEDLYISCLSGSVSLNFLASCSKLKLLHLHHIRIPPPPGSLLGHPDGFAEMFDVTSLIIEDRYELYESNIWELIPSLQLVKMFDFANLGEDGWPRINYHRATYEHGKSEK